MNKNIDTLIIGNNITSFLTSSQILKSGHDAVYLKDQRIKSNDPYFKFYGPIDLAFIKTWISDIDEESSIFKRSNFELAPFCLLVNSKRYEFASPRPYLNYSQVTRQFPNLHAQLQQILASEQKEISDFEEDFLTAVSRLGESLCRYKTIHQVSVATFKSALPDYIYDCYSSFRREFKNNSELQKLMSSLRCIYTQSIELTFSDLELIYFFIVLLSPRYRFIWSLALEAQAKDAIEKLGGVTLEDTIEEFSFSNARPWATQLASYSGVVAPSKMAIFSSNVERLGIGHDLSSVYGCIKLNYKMSDNLLSGEYYHFDAYSFGSDVAFIRKKIGGDGVCEVKVYSRFEDCFKVDFVQDMFHKLLIENEIIDSQDVLLNCVAIDEVCLLRNHGLLNARENVKLKFRTGSRGKLESVKGVYYHGPLKKNNLGITQTLLEARDYKTFV
ncbi:hypothetical protein DAY19_12045 [Halobacteriovorax vibrionivorans]|uniref:Uncharacterized protein n=1 Tax=Halobacteriovorax vibrionivorans TaxID=2152716 RepID=A0ABY0ICN7_9BACT|nr:MULTISPECIES: hypothetical protein [Halobacteriovorax]RZF20710.1 hypothetical protein DAY19_12045 [Halobacteriovorax vibrionivorans]TGD48881.1 hypothetical protein EP118_01685 [Halobacteriovorax sp. Y22]